MKHYVFRFLALLLTISVSLFFTAAAGQSQIDDPVYVNLGDDPAVVTIESNSGEATLSCRVDCLKCDGCKIKDICVLVSKNDEVYRYFATRNATVVVPFNMGTGNYKIIVGHLIKPATAHAVRTLTVNADFKNENSPFLSSSQIVNWNKSMDCVTEAKKLKSAKNEASTVEAVVKYIQNKFEYKNPNIQPGYIPDLDSVFKSKTGICFDFAALCCAMLRSQGIPAKLNMGYSDYIDPKQYHAWCQAYVNGKWVTIDPTYENKRGLIFLDENKMHIVKTY